MIFSFLLLLFIPSRLLPEEKPFWQFANTLYYEHMSVQVDRDVHTRDDTFRDDSISHIYERFQSFYYPEYFRSLHPDTRLIFFGVNFIYERNENYVKKVGVELQSGFGEPSKTLLVWGFGVSRQKDMVFEKSNFWNSNFFFNAGYPDDLHFYMNLENFVMWFAEDNIARSGMIEYDVAIGWKEKLPLFLRVNGSDYINQRKEVDYYKVVTLSSESVYCHLQYYGQSLDASLAYSLYESRIYKYVYLEDRGCYDGSVVSKKKYQGGGMSFNVKNLLGKHLSLNGEFYLLKGEGRFITISKIGTKVYF